MTPEEVIEIVKGSRETKYIICNADEGDPEHIWIEV